MEARIPEEVITQIRQATNIVDLVSEYVALSKRGHNHIGLCPFHSEKTPSFSVSQPKQIFHCFGCGVGGDVIGFLIEIDNLTFVEALKLLAARANLSFAELSSTPVHYQKNNSDNSDKAQPQMIQALDVAAKLYQHTLLNTSMGEKALSYLIHNRGLTPDTIKEFGIGYASSNNKFLVDSLQARGFSLNLLEKSGLIMSRGTGLDSYCDRFWDRIMFPIHDHRGQMIAFGGRTLGDKEPKYLNSPETLLFSKSKHLYNLHRSKNIIRQEKSCILVEGYLDVIACWQNGFTNVIAALGTSLGSHQAALIKRLADTTLLLFDADTAGKEAAIRCSDTLSEVGCSVKVASLPQKSDPDEVLRQKDGASIFRRILDDAVSCSAFKLSVLKESYQLDTEQGKLDYLVQAVRIISSLTTAIEQEHYFQRLAREFNISVNVLKEEQAKVKGLKKRTRINRTQLSLTDKNYKSDNKFIKAEQLLLAHMLQDPSLIKQVMQQLGDGFCDDLHSVLAAYMYKYASIPEQFNIRKLMDQLADDKHLTNLVAYLAMLELPVQLSQTAFSDYISSVRKYPIKQNLKEKKQRIAELALQDPVGAAHIALEIGKLKEQLK